MAKKPAKKKPGKDYQQIARKVLDAIAPDAEPPKSKRTVTEAEQRRAAAAILGSLGGKKGGPARAAKLSKARRSEIAQKAAAARWKSKKRSKTK